MKKRIFSAVLILIMLLAIPSCSMDQLTEFVGKMNENVMGVDPENAAKAEEAINNSTTAAGDEEKKEMQGTINDIFATGDSDTPNVKIPENVLDNLNADKIGNLANSINKAAGAAGFGDSMKKPAANDAATKGSAGLVTDIVNTVMNNEGNGAIPELGKDTELPAEAKDMVNALIGGINKINGKGTSESEEEPYEPTQADAVILQMVQSIVVTVASEDGPIKDAIKEGSFDGVDPTELITEDNKKMLQSAIDTINVLAPHSAFEGLNINLDSLLDSFMNGEGASNA